jgi:hypothetical protein
MTIEVWVAKRVVLKSKTVIKKVSFPLGLVFHRPVALLALFTFNGAGAMVEWLEGFDHTKARDVARRRHIFQSFREVIGSKPLGRCAAQA